MKALPSEVIERIFARMSALYGAQFTRQWAGVPADAMKYTWGMELSGYHPAEITRGLELCRHREFPPNVPEFKKLCRPELDMEALFFEAARLWPAREGWSSPVAYWAALAIGDDVRKVPYAAMKGRWREAFQRAQADPRPIPLPEALPQLENRPYTAQDVEAARERAFAKWRKP